MNDELVGCIAIDGEDLGNNKAHLRWFFVSEKARGTGLGHKLIKAALDFVDCNGFAETQLNTIEGLGAAHHLYIKYGFECTHAVTGDQWGKELTEQVFTRVTSTATP